jgi:hypothetical protein
MSESEISMELETYSPIFHRPNSQTQRVPNRLVDESKPIPVIDLHSLNPDDLGKACRDCWLFRLVNHDIPSALLSQLHEHAKRFFSLSFESKQAIFTNPLPYLWGTTAITTSGAALMTSPQNIHWVDGFHFPLCQLLQLQSKDLILASLWYLHFSFLSLVSFLLVDCGELLLSTCTNWSGKKISYMDRTVIL